MSRVPRLVSYALSSGLALCLLLAALGVRAPAARAADGKQLLERLKVALKKGNESERSEAVRDVGRLNRDLNDSQAKVAAMTLRRALEEEESGEVRRLMIRALARFKNTHAWLAVIWASTEERDPVIKDQARQELLSGGSDFLEVVARLLREDESPSFSADLVLVLGDRRKPDAIPLLLDVLEKRSPALHPKVKGDPIVRSAAAEALEAISGKAFGYDPKPWRAWHAAWVKRRPAKAGPSVSTGGRVEEPVPHVGRGLHPNFGPLRLNSKDIVFLVDISGSVGSESVKRAKRRLVEAVSLLGSDVRLAAVFFSDKVQMWPRVEKGQARFCRATPRNKEDFAKFLRELKPGNRTDIYTPLNAGLKLLTDRVNAKRAAKEPIREAVALVLVSDGQHNLDTTPPRVVVDKIDRLDPSATVLHAVVLGPKDSRLMAAVARLGGGHYERFDP